MIDTENWFVRDGDIAELLAMSRSWARKQRRFRCADLEHPHDIEPVMISSSS